MQGFYSLVWRFVLHAMIIKDNKGEYYNACSNDLLSVAGNIPVWLGSCMF